ncbi:P-loop containing dynein motor region D3-domain-containing protein [Pavlovales sp. CCMP2436]|nr:P-loop containing dynein motor region D3-domain-containing protein [Pavlovales sp. CCMP2436]
MAGAAVAVVRAQALQLADGLGVAGREHAGRLVVALAVGALFRLAGPPRQSHAPQAGEKQCTGAQGQGGGGGRAAGSAGAAGSGGGGGGHPAQEAHFGGGWSLGATVDACSRKAFDEFVRALAAKQIPDAIARELPAATAAPSALHAAGSAADTGAAGSAGTGQAMRASCAEPLLRTSTSALGFELTFPPDADPIVAPPLEEGGSASRPPLAAGGGASKRGSFAASEGSSLFEYCYRLDERSRSGAGGRWCPWRETQPPTAALSVQQKSWAGLHALVVPTALSTALCYQLRTLTAAGTHCLLIGSTGTGKTAAINAVLEGSLSTQAGRGRRGGSGALYCLLRATCDSIFPSLPPPPLAVVASAAEERAYAQCRQHAPLRGAHNPSSAASGSAAADSGGAAVAAGGPVRFRHVRVHFSARTQPESTQAVVEGALEKRRKSVEERAFEKRREAIRVALDLHPTPLPAHPTLSFPPYLPPSLCLSQGVFGPPHGTRALVFVDDLAMPACEEYGAQPPIELLRQLLDGGGWYDVKPGASPAFRTLQDVQVLAAMGPSAGGGRNSVSGRLSRHLHVLAAVEYDERALVAIFETIVTAHLERGDASEPGGGEGGGGGGEGQPFDVEVRALRSRLVLATVRLHAAVASALLPTPLKPHYAFNLRDMRRLVLGLCRCEPLHYRTAEGMVRLWAHEAERVYADRLVDAKDKSHFDKLLETQLGQHFDLRYAQLVGGEGASESDKTDNFTGQPGEGEGEGPRLLFADFFPLRPSTQPAFVSAAVSGAAAGGEGEGEEDDDIASFEDEPLRAIGKLRSAVLPPSYVDVGSDAKPLVKVLGAYLYELNAGAQGQTLPLVLFDYAAVHVASPNPNHASLPQPPRRLARVLATPQGHALLIGVGGSGRQSLARLAVHTVGALWFVPERSRTYGMAEWRDDLSKLLPSENTTMIQQLTALRLLALAGGGAGKSSAKGAASAGAGSGGGGGGWGGASAQEKAAPVVLCLSDAQLGNEAFLEDINALLNLGEVPHLCALPLLPTTARSLCPLSAPSPLPLCSKCLLRVSAPPSQLYPDENLLIGGGFAADEKLTLLEEVAAFAKSCAVEGISLPGGAGGGAAALTSEGDGEGGGGEGGKGAERTSAQLWALFVQLVQARLRIVLALSPVGPSLRGRLRNFPSLVNCCTVDWFAPWPKEALASVAAAFLDDPSTGLPPGLPTAALTERGGRPLARDQARQRGGGEDARAGRGGGDSRTRAGYLRIGIAFFLFFIANAASAEAIKDECTAELASAEPALAAASKALATLKKEDIVEVRIFKTPPMGVKLTMEAVCIMLQVPPSKAPKAKLGGDEGDEISVSNLYWEPARKQLAAGIKFLDRLLAYDKDNIPQATVDKIELFLARAGSDFSQEKIRTVNKACEGLCLWVRPLPLSLFLSPLANPVPNPGPEEDVPVVRPKRERLAKAEAEYLQVSIALAAKKEQLAAVERELSTLQATLDATQARQADLQAQVKN